MILSSTRFDPDLPYWQDFLPLIRQLAGSVFPACDQLNALLPPGLNSHTGRPIHFVASDQLDDQAYELRIYDSGRVSTRQGCWHDLFNALVWMRFPAIKSAMNACHYRAWSQQTNDGRGPIRDALTLFDECGAIVLSRQRSLLEAIAQRHWPDVFQRPGFHDQADVMIVGHAMLEKFLSPYKAMTAKVLLVHDDTNEPMPERSAMLKHLDQVIARGTLQQKLLNHPACLAPLPLAGIPGWWSREQQASEAFYADSAVFRPPPSQLAPATLFSLKELLA